MDKREEMKELDELDEQEAKLEVLKFTDRLRSAGIRIAALSYNGFESQTFEEELQLGGPGGAPVNAELVPEIGLRRLKGLLSILLPHDYAEGDGGFGTIRFEVETGRICVEHTGYAMENQPEAPREI